MVGDWLRESYRRKNRALCLSHNGRCPAKREIINGAKQRAVVEDANPARTTVFPGSPEAQNCGRVFLRPDPRRCYTRTEVLAVIEDRLVVPAHTGEASGLDGVSIRPEQTDDDVVLKPARGVETLNKAGWLVGEKIFDAVKGELASDGKQIRESRPNKLDVAAELIK